MDECGHRHRNLKVDGNKKTTMVPFHWVRRWKDHLDYRTDKTFLGSFNLSSIITQAPYCPGGKAYASWVCHNYCDPIADVCVKFWGKTGTGPEKKAYASQVWHNDCDHIAEVCVKWWGKTGIDREKKSYTSRVWHNYRDPIADVCVECDWYQLNKIGVDEASC